MKEIPNSKTLERSKVSSYVCGKGCVKTGGNLTGSLGFGAGCAFSSTIFALADGAAFFGAGDSDGGVAVGFGAVIDGKGGDATADDVLPVFENEMI